MTLNESDLFGENASFRDDSKKRNNEIAVKERLPKKKSVDDLQSELQRVKSDRQTMQKQISSGERNSPEAVMQFQALVDRERTLSSEVDFLKINKTGKSARIEKKPVLEKKETPRVQKEQELAYYDQLNIEDENDDWMFEVASSRQKKKFAQEQTNQLSALFQNLSELEVNSPQYRDAYAKFTKDFQVLARAGAEQYKIPAGLANKMTPTVCLIKPLEKMGKMADVFLGRDVLGREIVVKVYKSKEPRRLMRLINEMFVMAKMVDSPYIVPILGGQIDVGELGENEVALGAYVKQKKENVLAGEDTKSRYAAASAFFTMPYIRGSDLEDVAQERESDIKNSEKFRVELVKKIINDIAYALSAIHRPDVNVVHRDVKPSNIYFDAKANRFMLGDFGLGLDLNTEQFLKESRMHNRGLSKSREKEMRKKNIDPSTRTLVSNDGTVAGTPIFMAPEQAQGKAQTKSDIFALGAVIHNIICENDVFDGLNIFQVITSVGNGAMVPMMIEDLKKALPAKEAGLVAKMLQVDPNLRISAQGLIKALKPSWFSRIKKRIQK